MRVADLFDIKITRKLILLFAAISILLVGISIVSLLYLNYTINRLSDSLYDDVYENSELILNADRDLYQAAVALHTAMSQNITDAERDQLAQVFEANNAQAEERVSIARSNITSIKRPYNDMKQGALLLAKLKKELDSFDVAYANWKDTGRGLLEERVLSGWDGASFSAVLVNTQLDEIRSSLDRSEDLIGSYAEEVTSVFQDKKSSLFALYSLLLCLLILFIIYLGRKIISLQNEMLEEQTLYQLIG
jgi:cell division protein FtsL